MTEKETKKRVHKPFTKWEFRYADKVNAKLKEKDITLKQLTKMCGSTNYGNFKRFFEDKKGNLRSRTIGKINEVLKIK